MVDGKWKMAEAGIWPLFPSSIYQFSVQAWVFQRPRGEGWRRLHPSVTSRTAPAAARPSGYLMATRMKLCGVAAGVARLVRLLVGEERDVAALPGGDRRLAVDRKPHVQRPEHDRDLPELVCGAGRFLEARGGRHAIRRGIRPLRQDGRLHVGPAACGERGRPRLGRLEFDEDPIDRCLARIRRAVGVCRRVGRLLALHRPFRLGTVRPFEGAGRVSQRDEDRVGMAVHLALLADGIVDLQYPDGIVLGEHLVVRRVDLHGVLREGRRRQGDRDRRQGCDDSHCCSMKKAG